MKWAWLRCAGVLALALGFAALPGAGWWQYHNWARRVHTRAEAVVRERSRLACLLRAIDWWLIDDPSAVQGYGLVGKTVQSPDLLQMIRSSPRGDIVTQMLESGRCLTDTWDHAVSLTFWRAGGAGPVLRVTIRSFGPNGVDEHGAGDDLTAEGAVGLANQP